MKLHINKKIKQHKLKKNPIQYNANGNEIIQI